MRLGQSSLLRLTWNELRRRKVTRVGAIYAIVAWVVLQLAEITFEPLGFPDRVLTWTVLGVILGFPVALVLAWFFDVSPAGIVRDRGVGAAAGRAFALIVVLLTVGGLGWWLSEVYGDDDDAPAEARVAALAASAPANAIAVLPFDDMSPARDHRHLSDGIAEELLDRLARMRGLRVAARTSSFALRDFAGGITEIGRLLNVRWVLEGSVRRSEGRVRVTAQLIDAESGFHAWSETYERPGEDLFALQDEVTEAIAAELARRVGGVEGAAAGDMGTRSPEALDLYLRGRQAWRQRGAASLAQAEELFRQAVARDPDYAQAWCGLADTYLVQASYGLRHTFEAIELAEPAAVRAITLNPGLGEAWASIGLLRSMAGQFGPARRSLEEAIRLDPRNEMARMWLAGVHNSEGRIDEQRRVLEQAHELNPLEPVLNVNLASLMAGTGDVAGGRALLERVLAITPDNPLLLRTLAVIELNVGQLGRALELARAAQRAEPDAPATLGILVHVLATLEDFPAAEAVAHTLPADGPYRWMLLQQIAVRRGAGGVLPELEERARALQATPSPFSGQDVQVLQLAGFAELLADRPEQAAGYLRSLVGDPARLSEDSRLLEPASLLVTALTAAGEAAEAERIGRILIEATIERLARVPDSAETHYIRAQLALHAGDRTGAQRFLQAAYDAGFRERWLLRHDPRLAALHGAPETIALYERIGRDLAAAH